MQNFYGLIMAGGSGTRLWPISREYYPKQFLKLYGDQTLIQQTFIRLKSCINVKNIFVTTNRIFVDEIITQLKKYGLSTNNIIIQPADKNTGPTLTLVAKKIYDQDPSAIIINCPSDHLIEPTSAFKSAAKAGYKLAQKGKLVTFGIKPTHPNPEYGYIIPSKNHFTKINSNSGFKVEKFIEKPNSRKAASLIKEGSSWNSGIFIWKAETIIAEIKKWDNKIYEAIDVNKKYLTLDPISIDNSVLEKSDLVWVIPPKFKIWKDIGSWKALHELLPKDTQDNVINNRVIALDCENSLIYGTEGRSVTAINIKDIIVVDTSDSVLVAHRDNVHLVKEALKQLEIKTLIKKLQKPLVSIIIPTYNDAKFIEDTLLSIQTQDYKNIEYIVVDGGSTDKTKEIIKKYQHKIEHFLVAPTLKSFEKINRGIEVANGEIIGILNPGDSYTDNKVIKEIVERMEKDSAGISWGDLVYVGGNTRRISMYWKSSKYQKGKLQQGWHPPHPTFFVRRLVYEKYGAFNLRFKVAAEYELMLRFLEKHHIKSSYLPRILVKMQGKGLSLKSIFDRFIGNFESYKSWEENGLRISPLILISKNLSKISQFWKKEELDLT